LQSSRSALRRVWFAGVVALGLFCAIAWYLAPLQPNILALQFAFTPRAFGEVVHQWTGEPLHRFRMHLLADSALLVSHGLAWMPQTRADGPGDCLQNWVSFAMHGALAGNTLEE